MTEPEVTLPDDGGLGGVLTVVSVAVPWLVTVAGMALWTALNGGGGLGNFIGLLIVVLSPILWLLPLWMVPPAPGSGSYAAPLLLFLVPVLLVGSATVATEDLSQALRWRELADSAQRDGRERHIPLYEDGYRSFMAVRDGLRISVGGGALAALLEVLGLWYWTRRRPAQRWSIALLLVLFGPCVAGAIYLLYLF